MKKNLLNKVIACSLFVSSAFVVTAGIINQPVVVQADDREVFKGNISIQGPTTYLGRKAVSIAIPNGMRVKDAGVDNEPHDDIEEAVVGNKVIIYGLRDGVTYSNLRLKLENFSDVEYIYNINPFTVGGGAAPAQPNTQVNQPPVYQPNTQANTGSVQDYLRKVYQNVFGRQIDAQGLNYWTTKLTTGAIELEDFFKNLLSEAEFMQAAPTVEMKIKKLYAGIFQREADQGGFNFWVQKYRQELREEGSEREALRDVIDEMTDGPEFKQLLVRLGLNFDN